MRLVLCCLLLPSVLTSAEVIADLPASPGITRDDDSGSRWRTLPITSTDAQRNVLVQVAGQTITVARALVTQDDVQAAALLPALLTRATAAGVDPASLRLERGVFTGVHLRGSDVLVLEHTVLRRSPMPAHAAERRAAITTAAAVMVAAVDRTTWSPPVRAVLRRLLSTLDQDTVADEEFRPALVRALIIQGWLTAELGGLPELAPLREAVRMAETLEVVQRWNGEDTTLDELVDAFGRRVVTLRSPSASARLQPHAPSSYDATPTRMVVQYFPAGRDPLSDGLPLRAECWWGRMRIATWDATDGFAADTAAWRMALADDGPGVGEDTVVDWRPPHLVLSDASGAVTGLCTTHGLLRPVASASQDERERFLADAARLCPDAAHLDLIGQYLFAYVHDSPEPKHPHLIGVRGSIGEIHQTVSQTLDTVCAGVMRGDCDDLSEFYHAVLTRQGHLPQVFNLPRHAACAWSSRHGDQWTTQMLHTGQPLAFHGETLEESLAQGFSHFDQQNTDNGTLVHVLLRFAGENTRSAWRLGSRIMQDSDYARAMIAVQRDWHFHTHARAITTMQEMIAAGDDASANWSELAGLYRRTGQWQAAVAAEGESLKRIDDPIAQIDGRLTSISLMVRGELDQDVDREARALMKTVAEVFAKEPPDFLRVLHSLYIRIDPERHPALAQELLVRHLLPRMEKRRPELLQWARTRFDTRTWVAQASEERAQAGTLISTALAGLEERPDDHDPDRDQTQRRLLQFSERWLTDLAFLDTGDRDDVMNSYAMVGQLAEALLGGQVVDAMLAQCQEPHAWRERHDQRVDGLPQLTRDLPWIRISAPYWSGRLSRLLGETDVLLDEAAAFVLIAHLRAAIAAYQRLDIDPTGQDHTLRWAALIEALLQGQDDELRTVLRTYAERRDRRSDEMVTTTIATMARHLPPAWFARVLSVWDETAATKPGYFALAWECAIRGDIPQALAAGALGAQRHADDPAFVAEYTYLQHVLAGGEKP